MILSPVAWNVFNIEIFDTEASSMKIESTNSNLLKVVKYSGKSDSNIQQTVDQVIRSHYLNADSIIAESEWVFQESTGEDFQMVKYRFTPEKTTYEIVFLIDPKTNTIIGGNTIGEQIINQMNLEEDSSGFQQILEFQDVCTQNSEKNYSMSECIQLFQ